MKGIKTKTIYDYFLIQEGITIKERNKIVDILYFKLDEDTKNILNGYLNGEFASEDSRHKIVRKSILNMQKEYDKYGKELLNPDFEIPKKEEKSTIYDYFPIQEGMTEEERNQIVDNMFAKRDTETKDLINKYIAHEFDTKDERYIIVRNALSNMRSKYKKYGKKYLDPEFDSKRKEYNAFSDYFPIQEGMTEEERNIILDNLLKTLSEEEKNSITNYFNGEKDSKEKALKIVQFLQTKYKKYGKELLNPDFEIPKKEEKSTIYDYFPTQEGMTEEERNKIVDNMVAKQDTEAKDLINKYIANEFDTKDERYIIVRNALRNMRGKYKRYGKKYLDPEFDSKRKEYNAFSDYFPIQEGMTEEERNIILDNLLKTLSEEEKNSITNYFNGEKDSKEKALKIVQFLQTKYKKYGKELLNPDFEIPKKKEEKSTIYDYFPIQEGMTEEEKIQIVDLLYIGLSYTEQAQLNNIFLYKSNTGPIIAKMKYKYRKYGKQILDCDIDYLCSVAINLINKEFGVKLKNIKEENKEVFAEALRMIKKCDSSGMFLYNFVYKIYNSFLEQPWTLEEFLKDFILSNQNAISKGCYYDASATMDPSDPEINKEKIIELSTKKAADLIDKVLKIQPDEEKIEPDNFRIMISLIITTLQNIEIGYYKARLYVPLKIEITQSYINNLKIAEYRHRVILGETKKQYIEYFKKKVKEIFSINCCDVESILYTFINYEKGLLKEDTRRA